MTHPPTAPLPPTPAAGPPPAAPSGANWLPVVRLLAVVVTLVAITVGVLTVVSTFFERDRTETRAFPGTITSLHVTEDVGDVRVRPVAPGEDPTVVARISESFADGAWSAGLRDGALVVDGNCRQRGFAFFDCSVDLEITVPVDIPVNIESSTGDVILTGAFPTVDARTSTGDVLVQEAAGTVRLRTNTGDVRSLRTSAATVSAETTTGDVRLLFDVEPTTVSAETTTGDVTVLVPEASTVYTVTTDTDTGDARVDVSDVPAASREIIARTNTGDIRVAYR